MIYTQNVWMDVYCDIVKAKRLEIANSSKGKGQINYGLAIYQEKYMVVKKNEIPFLKNFNWRLITLQYCSGFAIH